MKKIIGPGLIEERQAPEPPSPVQLYISLGSGQDLGITKDDHLVVVDYSNFRIDLGRVTRKRIEEIQELLERLKIHAIEEKIL